MTPAGPPQAADGRSRRSVFAQVAGQAFAWGMLISTLAGAVSGTLLVPLLGTMFGAVIGAAAGLVFSGVGAYLVVWSLQPLWPDADSEAVRRSLRTCLYTYGAVAQVCAYIILIQFPDQDWHFYLFGWLGTLPVLVLLLPIAANNLTDTYIRTTQAPT